MITRLLLELQETKGKRKGVGNGAILYPEGPALADLAKAYVPGQLARNLSKIELFEGETGIEQSSVNKICKARGN